AGEAARGRVALDPVRRLAPQGGGLQPGAVVPLVHVQQVASDVLADHVPGCLVAAADAAELQAAALAQGEMEHARVLAERASARVADLARARGDVARQELAEVALAYEADAGGVLLGRGRQPGLGGDAAHLALGQRAER